MTCQIIVKIEQLIHGIITVKNGGFATDFTAMYGLHTVETRPLWLDLLRIHANTTGP